MTDIYGIVAHPAGHSLSPPMQNAGFKALGIDAEFRRFDIAPEKLSDFIQSTCRQELAGLAVSLPHKEKIITCLDGVTETAKQIGAVNTVFWHEDKLWGENTDASGFWQAIADSFSVNSNTRIAVIGAGGAARALVYILRQNGIGVTIFNRTHQKAVELAQEFDAEAAEIKSFMASDFDVVANSTAVGLNEQASPVPEQSWHNFDGVAFDAVFSPLKTLFLQHAEQSGGRIVTGDKMLLFQGLKQFEIWTKQKAPRVAMEMALSASIDRS